MPQYFVYCRETPKEANEIMNSFSFRFRKKNHSFEYDNQRNLYLLNGKNCLEITRPANVKDNAAPDYFNSLFSFLEYDSPLIEPRLGLVTARSVRKKFSSFSKNALKKLGKKFRKHSVVDFKNSEIGSIDDVL